MTSNSKYKRPLLKPTAYVCSICQKEQTSAAEVKKHLKLHKLFQCKKCQRSFQTCQQLSNHMVTHEQSITVSCSVCQKAFAHVRYLYQHMKIHSSKNRFLCEICGKGFAQLAHLNSHHATHQTEKPFSCKQCKKQFTCEGSLLRHSKSHDKNNFFKCKDCNKAFTRKASLVLHIQVIHENKLAHKCNECGRRFSQKAYLKQHFLKTHAKPETEKQNICITNKPPSSARFLISVLKKSVNILQNCNLPTTHQTSVLAMPIKLNTSSTNSTTMKETGFRSIHVEEREDSLELDTAVICKTYAPETLTEKELYGIFEKKGHSSLPLFNDESELLNPSDNNLQEDCFLYSFEDWECSLIDEALPLCTLDQECVSESSQDFNSKEFLNIISDEYLTSLQTTITF